MARVSKKLSNVPDGRTVEAYEDNAGGLKMVIFENGIPMHVGLTDEPSASLEEDIIAALMDGDLYHWGVWYDTERNSEGERDENGGWVTARDIYTSEIQSFFGPGGTKLIAEGSKWNININVNAMGIAGEKWYNKYKTAPNNQRKEIKT